MSCVTSIYINHIRTYTHTCQACHGRIPPWHQGHVLPEPCGEGGGGTSRAGTPQRSEEKGPDRWPRTDASKTPIGCWPMWGELNSDFDQDVGENRCGVLIYEVNVID